MILVSIIWSRIILFTNQIDVDVPEYVVKAQILAGGRGKGHFSNGFKGGVHFTNK